MSLKWGDSKGSQEEDLSINAHRISTLKQLQKENKILKEALERVAGMCGNPNAIYACRLINKTARETLEAIKKITTTKSNK